MIKVFSSKFSAQPTELYQEHGRSVGAWLEANIKSYKKGAPVSFSVSVDGVLLPQAKWHVKRIDSRSDVRIVIEPKGTELFFGGLFLVATQMMSPKIPKMNNLTNEQSKDLESPAAKGNKVKVNDARPELAGTFKLYGNYLKPMRRYFVDKRDQRVDMCLDLGIGEIDLTGSDIYIGDTNVSAYGDNASYAIYKPGESLAGDPRAQWWHDVQEVGSGSNGSSGLTMTEAADLTESYVAYSQIFSGTSIVIPAGSGNFPSDWTAGIIVRATVPYVYEVLDDATADIIRGDAVKMLAPVVGQSIEIAGANAGFYTVRSYTPAQAAKPATPGSAAYFTGNSSPSTFDFSAVPETISVRVATTNYSITINTNTTNLAGLVAAINTARGTAPIEAVVQGTAVRIRDRTTPYTGRAVTLATTGTTKIFGASTTAVAGVAATAEVPAVIAQITLNLPDGTPARQMALGSQAMSIGPSGQRYRVLTATTSTLTVARLTSTGAVDNSFPGFDALNTPAAVIQLDPSNRQGGYRGPFAACPEGEKTDTIEWDVFHPQGLYGLGREGQIYEVNSYHSLEYRDADIAGAWTVLERQSTGGKIDAMGFTYGATLPYPMRAEVRIVKRFVSQPGRVDEEKNDEIVWYGMRSRLSGNATVYARSTVLCMTIRGGDYLSADSEAQVWVKGTKVIPVRRDGAWQPAQPTNEIDAYCLYVLKDAGYTDDQLDLAEWDRLGALWRARGDTFDWQFKDQQTVLQIVEKALKCGFSELTVRNGLLTPVRDEPQTAFQALYTADTQGDGGALDIRFELPSGDDFDGIDVRYMDHGQWQIATVKCRIPGAPAARRVKVIDADGLSNRDKAYQFGMRELMEQKYLRKTCSWATEMSAFNSNYMDYVQVSGECPGYAQSTIMTGYDAATLTITLDRPVDWDGIPTSALASVRLLDGKCYGPVRATRVSDTSFSIEEPLPFAPLINVPGIEPPYVLVGQGYAVQITDIKPDGTDSARCEGRFYTPEIYTYDDTPAP